MPTDRMLRWVAAAFGPGARVTQVRPLHGDGPPWLLSVEDQRGATAAILRTPDFRRVGSFMIRTAAAALQAAERNGLSAPRLIRADLAGADAGALATLETVISGSCLWPGPPSAEQLRASGAALAPVHAIRMAPSKDLPFRPRPIAVDDFAADRRDGRMTSTSLLDQADRLIAAHGPPPSETVFVHGDVWPGNIIWTADSAAVLIDWKTAGVGAPGVDLGELRKQAAIICGPDAPQLVLDGWQAAAGRQAEHVAYWDAVAALNTPTEVDLAYGGNPTERRDAFLAAALMELS